MLTLVPSGGAYAVLGQPYGVNVELSGLEPNQQLDSLLATISFESEVFGTSSVSVGAIVPVPLDDPLDLLVTEGVGLADVAFLTFGIETVDHITSNGTLFSMEVTPVAFGTSSFVVDFVGATLFNSADPSDPIEVSGSPNRQGRS